MRQFRDLIPHDDLKKRFSSVPPRRILSWLAELPTANPRRHPRRPTRVRGSLPTAGSVVESQLNSNASKKP
jgi:hypothetical protein